VLGVRKNNKNILQKPDVMLLEEPVGRFDIACGEVVNELQANYQSCIGNISHRVFKSPDYTVKEERKVGGRKLQECWKTVHVDRLDHFEKAYSVFWIFCHVFIDHIKGTGEHRAHDCRNLFCNPTLNRVSKIYGS
jgi:hypothetical protein